MLDGNYGICNSGRSIISISTHHCMLIWVSILRLLKCLTRSTYAKTDAWTFHPHSEAEPGSIRTPIWGVLSQIVEIHEHSRSISDDWGA